MQMIQAVIRPERESEVVAALEKTGFHGFTRLDVYGRGRQRGLRAGAVHYPELAKVLLWVAVEDDQAERALEAIRVAACSGNPGDGKLFSARLEQWRTIRERPQPAAVATPPPVRPSGA